MMNNLTLLQGDCLELMKDIPDGSVDLLEIFINESSNENEVVFDPFMGSGSTGVACINTGRKFIGIELDKQYFDITFKRIAEAQGKVKANVMD